MKATLQPAAGVEGKLTTAAAGAALVAREVVARVAPASPSATLTEAGGVRATLKAVARAVP